MDNNRQLYFIAIIPPVEICNVLTGFKEDIAARFASKAALKTVPHITLKAPFKKPLDMEAETIQWFQSMMVSVSSFQQELRNFSAFKNKRNPVIYVQPIMNNALQELQKEVLSNYSDRHPQDSIPNNEKEFHPHLTIAFRDLKPAAFHEAWKEYSNKEYDETFQVDCFHLLQHDGKRWNVASTYRLHTS